MLRSTLNFMPAFRFRSDAPKIAGALFVAAALGGCSADLLRFDSPVFGWSDEEKASSQRVGGDRTLFESRGDAIDQGSAAPVASVDRGGVADNRPPTRLAQPRPPIAEPSATQENAPIVPETTGALGSRSITVQSGDTLYQLARRHGVSVSALRRANGLQGNVIRPGQQLTLPGDGERTPAFRSEPSYETQRSRRASRPPVDDAGTTYVIRPGDNLYGIARQHGTSVSSIMRLNGITDPRRLRPGQTLQISGTPSRTASRGDSGAAPVYPKTRKVTTSRYVPSSGKPRILNPRPSEVEEPLPRKASVKPPAPVSEVENRFRWPARGRIIASFNHSGNGVKNDGINIALPIGTEIRAAESGVVAYAGSELAGYGKLVLLRHDNGWVSAYAHNSEMLVKRGDKVRRGQVIAKAGRSGNVTQPQLHFELRQGAKPVDPLPHLAKL